MDRERRQRIDDAIARLADGDRSAMGGSLVEDLWPVLLAFTKRRIRRAEDAEDVAQEVFMKICARSSDFDPEKGDGVAWCLTIASYEILTHRKKELRRREADPRTTELPLEDRLDPNPLAEDLLIDEEQSLALATAARALSPSDRIALGLSDGGGIASSSSSSSSATHRKRKQRALDRLREIWRRLSIGDG